MKPISEILFSRPLEYSSSDFVAKLNNKSFKKYLLVITILLIITAISFRNEIPQWSMTQKVTLSIVLAGFFLYIGFRAFDERPQLVISKAGIATKKRGFVAWDNIEYFNMEEVKDGEGSQFYFDFKLRDTNKIHKVETSDFDKTYLEIYAAVMEYSKGHNMIELVHEIG